jgi:hypothetical protein
MTAIGISKNNAITAIANWPSLKDMIESKNKNPDDFYLPVNEARTFVNERYRKHIPAMLETVRLGGPYIWDMLFSSEDIDTIMPDTESGMIIDGSR